MDNKNKIITIITICLAIVLIIGTFTYFKLKKNSNEEKSQKTNIMDNQNSVNNRNDNENSNKEENEAFIYAIEDSFDFTKGIAISGYIEKGTVKLNDTVEIIGLNDEIKTASIKRIFTMKGDLQTATVGDKVGLLLTGITKDEIKKGQVIATPNYISNVIKFDANVTMLPKDKNGNKSIIFTSNDDSKKDFEFRTVDIDGKITYPNNLEDIKPDSKVDITVELELPVAIEIGTEFQIRDEEHSKIGKGTVTKIYK